METSYLWIMNCIESSSNGFQFRCCTTLIKLFEAMYKDEEWLGERVSELSETLYEQEVKHGVEV